jgi:hypothetical protein
MKEARAEMRRQKIKTFLRNEKIKMIRKREALERRMQELEEDEEEREDFVKNLRF